MCDSIVMDEMGGLPLRVSRDAHAHPHLRRKQWDAADGALLHLSRAVATRALVAARHRDVRLGASKADDASRLAADARLGVRGTAGVELRVSERGHDGRAPLSRARRGRPARGRSLPAASTKPRPRVLIGRGRDRTCRVRVRVRVRVRGRGRGRVSGRVRVRVTLRLGLGLGLRLEG